MDFVSNFNLKTTKTNEDSVSNTGALDKVKEEFPKTKERDFRENDEEVLILVPNGLISIIIGSRGKHIRHLINEAKANIVVNQPIYKMMQRTITINGNIL